MTVWSCSITGGDYERAGLATRGLKEVLRCAGVDSTSLRRIMVASYEAEMNVVIHAHRGRLLADIGSSEVRVVVSDEGPGISDLKLAMTEGYSTAPEEARRLGFGAGLGLPNIKQHSDSFLLHSTVGSGTQVRFAVSFRSVHGDLPVTTSLQVRAERCRQCGRCVPACPVGCLRLREGGPRVLVHACIECTECAQVCPARVFGVDSAAAPEVAGAALVLATPGLERFPLGIAGADTRGALAERSLELRPPLRDWASALRIASARRAADSGRFILSSNCPAVVSLIALRHPALLGAVAPWLGALEAATSSGTDLAVVACPAQRTALLAAGVEAERVLSPEEFERLVAPLVAGTGAPGARAPVSLQPAGSTGPMVEGVPVIRIDGTRPVMRTLDLLEEGGLGGPVVLELYACAGGCDGSGFLSGSIAGLAEHLGEPWGPPAEGARAVDRVRSPTARYGQVLDPDMAKAIEKLTAIEDLSQKLSGRDCATCGAPTCRAFAEDVVMGRAFTTACPELCTGGVS